MSLAAIPDTVAYQYELTATDRVLVANAAVVFASDWRYLLDMVEAARRSAAPRKSRKSPPLPPDAG